MEKVLLDFEQPFERNRLHKKDGQNRANWIYCDGDHPPNDHTNTKEGGGDPKEAEEVQGMARNELK